MGRWRLFWANFAVLGAMKFPFCVVSARYGPEMRYGVFQGVCWGCSDFFCFAGPPFRAFRTFLPQAGGFYVGLRGCFQERLLCVFTWVTLSPSANHAGGRAHRNWQFPGLLRGAYLLNFNASRSPAGAEEPPRQAQSTQPLGWYLEQGH